ncbi:uncharacterized protein BDZ99DRAFT_225343 [Mytilinidion resinicola]|uniref:Uncharacterized protein n=1 Tax=Mytilinidion resinicola TaxID=574789 RepID=A0A6A6Z0Q2_9PEZI|nr:uncharacterized protein BDZ99DRAFT_225343 [Mytilinidion resinicola]KAF2813807.1 hypothetical protein BDZ99DRAFT_225343 [Mytilinidion resinicola]
MIFQQYQFLALHQRPPNVPTTRPHRSILSPAQTPPPLTPKLPTLPNAHRSQIKAKKPVPSSKILTPLTPPSLPLTFISILPPKPPLLQPPHPQRMPLPTIPIAVRPRLPPPRPAPARALLAMPRVAALGAVLGAVVPVAMQLGVDDGRVQRAGGRVVGFVVGGHCGGGGARGFGLVLGKAERERERECVCVWCCGFVFGRGSVALCCVVEAF